MKSKLIAGLTFATFAITSCLKQNFENPPSALQYDPGLPVNLTVSQLARMAEDMSPNQYRTLGDSTIYGIIIADDRSGNFYKQIVIQDSTGGIVIGIDRTNLYSDLPAGRKVYVKLNGLLLVNYKSLPEVEFSAAITNGSLSTTGIPSALLADHVVKATYPNTVTPVKVKVTDLFSNTNRYLNMLVTLDNMEFDSLSMNVPYAGSVSSGASGTSRIIRDCPYTGSMVMYNSAYAWFQPNLTPTGKGSITGVFSIYNTPQFLIRDSTDVQLTGARDCQ